MSPDQFRKLIQARVATSDAIGRLDAAMSILKAVDESLGEIIMSVTLDKQEAPTPPVAAPPQAVAWYPSPEPNRKRYGRHCNLNNRWCRDCESDGACEQFR